MKDRNLMIIPTDAKKKKKSFNILPHLFMIKALNKLGMEGTYLNIIQSMYDKPQLTSYSMVKN